MKAKSSLTCPLPPPSVPYACKAVFNQQIPPPLYVPTQASLPWPVRPSVRGATGWRRGIPALTPPADGVSCGVHPDVSLC